MRSLYVVLATTALFLLSCGAGSGSENSGASAQATPGTAPVYDSALPKGRIMDSIVCRAKPTQSYSLYLPSYYNPDRQFPCIYFFDAHARGALPVRLYKALAEQYGFVFISSNISKNGMQWTESNEIVKAMMEDSRARINIDAKRIYTAGFSGGARVACSVAILDGGIAGVIGCAAGLPRVDHPFQTKFDYFGLVGNFDFNLTEMQQLDQALGQNGFPHQLLTFDGKHDWPPFQDFRTALLWLQANAIKENAQPKNDTLAAALKEDLSKRIAAAAGDAAMQQNLLAGLVATLGGLTDVASFKKQLDAGFTSDAYRSAMAMQGQLQEEEASGQQAFQQQIVTQDAAWWAKKIGQLQQNIQHAAPKQVAQMNQRLLNFLGLVSYLNASHAINSGDLAHAEGYLKIFKLADPTNPDCSYLTAQYYMKKGDAPMALTSLEEAAKAGYSEAATLLADPAFGSLQNGARFKDIVNKVSANIGE